MITVVFVTVMLQMTVYRIVPAYGVVMQRFQISIQMQMVMVWVLAVPYLFVMPMCHQVW